MKYVCLLLLIASAAASGASVSLCNVCNGWTLRQTSAGLEIRCPGQPQPYLTLAGCTGARATKLNGVVTVTCSNGMTATLR